jgi:hypothetical protein
LLKIEGIRFLLTKYIQFGRSLERNDGTINEYDIQQALFHLIVLFNTRLTISIRHQDYSIESPVIPTSPPPNSLDLKMTPTDSSVSTTSEEELDESDEDMENVHHSSAEIKFRYENQHNIFSKRAQEKKESTKTHMTSSPSKKIVENTCSSNACIARKDVEAANTESIRKHILMKLGMDEKKLNRTSFPKLNERIIENFCRRNKISPEICFGKKTETIEYQLDGPDESLYDEFVEDQFTSRENEENIKFLSYENRIYAFPSSKFFVVYFLHFLYSISFILYSHIFDC